MFAIEDANEVVVGDREFEYVIGEYVTVVFNEFIVVGATVVGEEFGWVIGFGIMMLVVGIVCGELFEEVLVIGWEVCAEVNEFEDVAFVITNGVDVAAVVFEFKVEVGTIVGLLVEFEVLEVAVVWNTVVGKELVAFMEVVIVVVFDELLVIIVEGNVDDVGRDEVDVKFWCWNSVVVGIVTVVVWDAHGAEQELGQNEIVNVEAQSVAVNTKLEHIGLS